uniref:Uncharacterized protein n=1 Tax=viral metagenome TaxID=1070528 RepID=A0A6C0BLU3_9ZZZZ
MIECDRFWDPRNIDNYLNTCYSQCINPTICVRF